MTDQDLMGQGILPRSIAEVPYGRCGHPAGDSGILRICRHQEQEEEGRRMLPGFMQRLQRLQREID